MRHHSARVPELLMWFSRATALGRSTEVSAAMLPARSSHLARVEVTSARYSPAAERLFVVMRADSWRHGILDSAIRPSPVL